MSEQTPTVGDLAGKVAIVTGAARGTGRETAKILAAAGARVVLADLPGAPLENAASEAGVYGEVADHVVDISDESSVEALVAFTVERFGGLDVLNNNAVLQGLPDDADVMHMSIDVWDRVFSVNARGTMLMCKHSVPVMVERGGGSIVNISSGTASAGQQYQSAYAASKGAIETLTKYAATQYGDRGVRCNCIAPGLIGTDTLRAAMPKALQEAVIGSKLIGRLADPSEISCVVLFLASDRSAFITGEIVRVDGGFFAHVPSMDAERRLTEGSTTVIDE